jgi:hypothetical protein
MPCVEHRPMLDEVLVPIQEPAPADPYGDVALGVECAWPETIPVLSQEDE